MRVDIAEFWSVDVNATEDHVGADPPAVLNAEVVAHAGLSGRDEGLAVLAEAEELELGGDQC